MPHLRGPLTKACTESTACMATFQAFRDSVTSRMQPLINKANSPATPGVLHNGVYFGACIVHCESTVDGGSIWSGNGAEGWVVPAPKASKTHACPSDYPYPITSRAGAPMAGNICYNVASCAAAGEGPCGSWCTFNAAVGKGQQITIIFGLYIVHRSIYNPSHYSAHFKLTRACGGFWIVP